MLCYKRVDLPFINVIGDGLAHLSPSARFHITIRNSQDTVSFGQKKKRNQLIVIVAQFYTTILERFVARVKVIPCIIPRRRSTDPWIVDYPVQFLAVSFEELFIL